MSSVSRSSQRSAGQRAMFEPESLRLQREVDICTQKLEHEKRRLLIVEEQIKQVKNEMGERNQSMQKIKPTQAQEKKDTQRITQLTKTNKTDQVKLNQIKAKNQKMRREIDTMRKDLQSSKGEVGRLSKSIKKTRKDVQNENQEYIVGSKIAEETNNQIIALKAKHEEEKDRFENEIKKLTERLKEKDEVIEFDDKNFDQTYASKDVAKQGATDFSNPIAILKLRLNKIIATNKEKKKLMDQYLRNVKVIEDAFEQISEATGISNVEEIVTTFIKAEEQNYSLFNYVNMLNTETDSLEESNNEIKTQINRILERGQLSEQEQLVLKGQLEGEVEYLEKEMEEAVFETDDVRRQFRKIQVHTENMVEAFKKSKFFLSVANKMSYDEGFVFSENNIIGYLAELEEYIGSLITYVAFKRDEPNAAISTIPLEHLKQKDFNKKEMAIEVPVTYEINQDHALPGETEEIISSKQLYKQFMRLVDGKNINFVTQAQARQQAHAGGANASAALAAIASAKHDDDNS